MSGPAEVPEIEMPAWVGQPFPAEGKLVEKLTKLGGKLGDLSAKGADFGDFAGELLGFTGPFNIIGFAGTAAAQIKDSTANRKWLKVVEGVLAGFLDAAMGIPLGPVLPAIDSLISSTGVKSPGDLAASGLRAGITALEGRITGERQGVETLQAKAIVGEYGKVMKGILGG